MNTNLFHARLDAEFLIPLLWKGWSCVYRPDEPVNLEELLYGCVETDSEWRRAEALGSAHLYYQVATSEVPLVLFEWPGPAEPIRGSLYLATFALRKKTPLAAQARPQSPAGSAPQGRPARRVPGLGRAGPRRDRARAGRGVLGVRLRGGGAAGPGPEGGVGLSGIR